MGDLATQAKANTIYCLHLKKEYIFLKRTLSYGSYDVKPDQWNRLLREDKTVLHENAD